MIEARWNYALLVLVSLLLCNAVRAETNPCTDRNGYQISRDPQCAVCTNNADQARTGDQPYPKYRDQDGSLHSVIPALETPEQRNKREDEEAKQRQEAFCGNATNACVKVAG